MPFAWFFAWRLLSGIVGGLLMILAPSLGAGARAGGAARAGGRADPHRGGVRHRGVRHAGAAADPLGADAGVARPGRRLPGADGVRLAWLARRRASRASPTGAPDGTAGRFGALCVSYGLCAVGLSPHMVFLVDYVARGLHWGLDAGSLTWVLFGAGALCGPLALGRLADRIGRGAGDARA